MIKTILYFVVSWLCCFIGSALAQTSIYCPQNHGYASVGMSEKEVLVACGQPTKKQKSQAPLMQKIPMMQLIYNNQGTSKAFYGVWSLPVGVSGGASLEVDVINNQVYAVNIGGESSKAFSVCGGAAIVRGDPVSKVYSACGNPSSINNTYVSVPVSNSVFPEIWIYEAPYQNSIRLTFLGGKLESIN